MKKYTYLFIALAAGLHFTACDSYLDIEPQGKVIPETLEENRGLITMAYNGFPAHKSRLTFRADELVLDEFSIDAPYYTDVYTWADVNPDPQTAAYPWSQFYNTIFYTNYIVTEGRKTIVDSADKNQLIGEAYALRAYAYFDLVNLYGKPYNEATADTDKAVPLALEIDLEQVFTPVSVARVYEQVLEDIAKAKELLVLETQETGMNYRFSVGAIHALEARVYLYRNQWEKALQAVEKALSYNNILVNLNADEQLPNRYDSPESVLALEDVYESDVNNAAYVSDMLTDRYDEDNDLRFALYFVQDGSRYKSNKGGAQQFKCSIRTAELYLIQAESLMKLERTEESKSVLFSLLRNRYRTAYIPTLESSIEAMNNTDYATALMEERARELALEGHRWFDLRRANQKEIQHTFNGEVYTLQANDPRYTLLYPQEAKLNNPEL
ncbi:RagB/SusD family nutrient uptake outer membrane protein [Sinomicrobium sp. M5D2P9]